MRSGILLIIILAIIGCQPKEVQEIKTSLFDEQYRPQYHFTPPAQWMNDPNGMVYYDGEYHLFYQHYPDSTVWGPMHWGHAVSTDMINWKHLPIALYPDSLGYIFSGSAVVDYQNTSGLGTLENPAMVAIFTYHDPVGADAGKIDYQTQGIAYSLDKGRTWTKYQNNPVLKNPGIIDFRDPKVFWNEQYQKWTMSLAVKDHITFYSSTNLIDWTLDSKFGHQIGGHGGVWECPDLFPLQDQEGNQKWVLLVSINPGGPQGGSATQYFVGDFDGSAFTPADTVTRWIDAGADNYAGVTFGGIPDTDDRRLFIGWMSNWLYANVVPTENWRSAMTIPRELLLKKVSSGYLLQSKPVAELNKIMNEPIALATGLNTIEEETYLLEINDIVDNQLAVTMSNPIGENLIIKVEGDSLWIDRSMSSIGFLNPDFATTHQTALDKIEVKSVKIYVDRSSIEVFVNDGLFVMTDIVFPSEKYNQIQVDADQAVKISKIPIQRIWKN